MLHLSGPAVLGQLFALGDSIPQFGDGLTKLLAPQDPAAQPSSEVGEGAPQGRPSSNAGPQNSVAETAGPVTLDLTATRAWGQMQVWSQNAPGAMPPHRRRK
jgi:hypothetical protein